MPEISRWYHSNGRKQRGTEEPLNESERGEWKSWLKAQHSENEDHGIRSHHSMGNRWRNSGSVSDFIFLGSKALQMVISAMKLKDAYSLEGKLWPTYIAYSKGETLLCQQGPSSQGYGFSSSHVWMWELDYKESWAPKNWCFWTVVLEKTLESPLDCKKIQPVHSKGDQSWIFIGRTDAEAETPILWPPDAKSWLIGKDPDAGKDWRQEEKGTTEDEMFGWHHWGNEFE